ncbi:MAG TPA: trehalose-6-phosphate synthase [Roseiarcus sp.]|nr:trehalose-6-phosphate synthase [Roseiarcus sp.]
MNLPFGAWLRHPRVRRWNASFLRMAKNPIVGLSLAGVIVVIVAMTQVAFVVVDHWSQRDIELRSSLVFRSIHDSVARGLEIKPEFTLQPYFEELAEDERLLALGYCNADGVLRYATKDMPKSVKCPEKGSLRGDSYYRVTYHGRPVSVAEFPLPDKEGGGELLVLHDLTFIQKRAHEAELYMALALVGVAAGLGLLGAVVVFVLMRGWTSAFRSAVVNLGRGGDGPRHTEAPIGGDIESMLAEIRLERRYAHGIHVEWSPDTLHQLLVEELPGAQVMVVSNREPYIHNRADDGEVTLQIPASGLVSAMEPVMRACGGVWIAHGSGTADREAVDRNDRVAVPPARPAYSLRRVWLTEDEQDGYYYGFANEGMWPLCHIAFVRPIFRDSDWLHYVAVNRRFAEAVVQEATREDPIVLVQDYHFALLPRMIRERLPRATVITFWHIPWPNPETFSICPWREEIIDGLLGSSILGFHTRFHCNNFLEGVDRFLESRIDRERNSVTLGGHETLVRSYPISIEWPPAAMEGQPSVEECRRLVTEKFGLKADVRIAVGIERFDYTKGIVERMHAVETLLELRPEWRGKFVFLQAAAPTRSKLDSYSSLQAEAVRTAEAINAKYGDGDYQPVVLSIRHHEPAEVFRMFRAADICVVSSLHDGMNLVAKEFIAARDDEQGVLLLSSFAGASRELAEAVMVNPYDAHGMADALDAALHMSPDAQRARIRAMRDIVSQRNVYLWAAQMLLDAARLRRRIALAQAAN